MDDFDKGMILSEIKIIVDRIADEVNHPRSEYKSAMSHAEENIAKIFDKRSCSGIAGPSEEVQV
jgi:hypothetical protein